MWKGYQGSSFGELLASDHSHLTFDWASVQQPGSQPLQVPHGTTVLAFKYADGVVVAGDRLATAGYEGTLRIWDLEMGKGLVEVIPVILERAGK